MLDYSYAGYDHGESVPVDGFAWGYKVINVKDRMDKDHLSAREALIKILDENKLVRVSSTSATNANAKIVIYFQQGIMICSRKVPLKNSLKFMGEIS